MSSSSEAKKYIKEHGKLSESFKRRWLEALDSGKYKQATGDLCKTSHDMGGKEFVEGYCCLGVAGHIQGMPIKLLEGKGFLDREIIKVAKSRKKNIPSILQEVNPVTDYLANLNDASKNFKRTRNWIEKNL